MFKKYSEDNVTWSSIEACIPYAKTVWSMHKNGISAFMFLDENGSKINIEEYNID